MPLIQRAACAISTGVQRYLGVGKTQLRYRFWSGSALDNPVVVYVHGIEGHSQWFDRSATQLSSYGINVYAADRRGAALNRDKADRLLTYKVLLDDLNLFVHEIKSQNPSSPLILFGNCWGAILSLIYSKTVCEEAAANSERARYLPANYIPIDGLILSCYWMTAAQSYSML